MRNGFYEETKSVALFLCHPKFKKKMKQEQLWMLWGVGLCLEWMRQSNAHYMTTPQRPTEFITGLDKKCIRDTLIRHKRSLLLFRQMLNHSCWGSYFIDKIKPGSFLREARKMIAVFDRTEVWKEDIKNGSL